MNDYHQIPTVQSVQLKAIRVYLGVHKYASNDFLTGDMGWYPSNLRHKISLLRYWNRLVKMDQTRLTKQVFEVEYANKGFWCTKIKELLNDLNLGQIYEHKSTCDLTFCKLKLEELYNEEWQKLLLKKPKLRSYCKWKFNLKVEPYVTYNLQRSERSIIAQLRSGTLPLMIETGRFSGKKLEERLCIFCDINTIESETHFLLECKCYEILRRQFLKNNVTNITLHQDLIMMELFDNHPRQLGKYITKIFNVRKEIEYKIN